LDCVGHGRSFYRVPAAIRACAIAAEPRARAGRSGVTPSPSALPRLPPSSILTVSRWRRIALFDPLAGGDIHRAYGRLIPPDPASIGLHECFGFRLTGTLTEVGRKFGRFWDVAVYLKAF
jgi:hypothetical protein